MKIGILGGTFNPIHKAHVHLVKEFYKALSLDKMLLIPSANPPHKVANQLANASDRVAMCKLALEDMPYCEISEIEIKRDGKSYTVNTLEELTKNNPNDEFYFLMGEDMFLTVQKWKDSEKIFDMATICSAPRSEDAMKKLSEHGKEVQKNYQNFKFIIVDIPYINASSTDVRQGDFSHLPQNVLDYIKEKKLYGSDNY